MMSLIVMCGSVDGGSDVDCEIDSECDFDFFSCDCAILVDERLRCDNDEPTVFGELFESVCVSLSVGLFVDFS